MRRQGLTPWRRAGDLAATQWNAATKAQLLWCGCSEAAIRTAVRAGHLFRPHHGVYTLGHPPSTPHERAMAAVLAGGPHALLSEDWGLWLWELGRLPSGLVHVTTPGTRQGGRGYVLHRSRRLTEADSDRQRGIPVTSPARTLADCASRLTAKQLRRAVNQAQITHLTSKEKLMEYAATRALVSEHGATRSILEELLLDLSRDHGLPRPEVDVEADGYAFHFTKVAFADDHERRLYLEAQGERVTAVDYKQVTTGRATTVARLRAILSR